MSKVWKVPASPKVVTSLPLPVNRVEPNQFYSLFRKVEGRWNQARMQVYPASFACKVYGEMVVKHPEMYSIRPAVVQLDGAR